MVDTSIDKTIRTVLKRLVDVPVSAASGLYVDLWPGGKGDPLVPLQRMIQSLSEDDESTGQSAQILSGYRGAGKSTQLLRLQSQLEREGYAVVLVDMAKYLHQTTAMGLMPFLFALALGVHESLQDKALVEKGGIRGSFLRRIWDYLNRTDLEAKELGLGIQVGSDEFGKTEANLKLALHTDPTFSQRLQKAAEGSLGQIVSEAGTFLLGCAQAVRQKSKNSKQEFVILVDSVERIRGNRQTASAVMDSVADLFINQAASLRFPGVHMIYSVHPYLSLLAANAGSLYDSSVRHIFPCVRTHTRTHDIDEEGIGLLGEVIRRRIPEEERRALFGDIKTEESMLREMALKSGGYVRDMIRIVRAAVFGAQNLPLTQDDLHNAYSQLMGDMLPIPLQDAQRLSEIAKKKDDCVPDQKGILEFARYIDEGLVAVYPNGPFWYDVHPLVRDRVLELAGGESA